MWFISYIKEVLLLVYILLQSKTGEAYRHALTQLCFMDNEISPSYILCDDEKAFHKAFIFVFRNSKVFGWFFHLSQTVWKKIQALSLTNLYCSSEEIRTYTKMLLALAFIPPSNIINAFESLQDLIPDQLEDLVLHLKTLCKKTLQERKKKRCYVSP